MSVELVLAWVSGGIFLEAFMFTRPRFVRVAKM